MPPCAAFERRATDAQNDPIEPWMQYGNICVRGAYWDKIMKKGKAVFAALALSLAATGAAWSAPSNLYTSLTVLGDSLSDPGNLHRISGGLLPENPPYRNGRFTNGEVWAEKVGRKFTDKGLAMNNFAFGGATAVTNADFIPDLTAQRDMVMGLSNTSLGNRAMVMIFIGSNDGFNTINGGGNVADAARAAARSIAANARYLFDNKSIRNFSFVNSPSLELTPRFRSGPDRDKAAEYTSVFNTTLLSETAALRTYGANVTDIDLNTPYTAAILDPTRIGMQPGSSLVPCIIPGVRVCDTLDPSEAEKLMFYDPVHPNSVAHAAIADLMSEYVAPVPLPAPLALLLAGLAGLLGVSRGRGQRLHPV